MRNVVAAVLCFALLSALVTPSAAQTIVRMEAVNHPRIAAAIREMEGAIMEAAPHDFGGHKEAAIRETRAAIVELRQALAYRARKDQ